MPATLVGTTQVKYQDADGDSVTVTLSKPVLTAANVNSIFTFDTGNVNGTLTTKQQLRTINLVGVAGVAGTTITTTAVRSATNGGDGFAALGQINATGIDIGAVTIDGDLGRILAGNATLTTQGLGALKVHSMGRYGTLSGATNLNSEIQGKFASLSVKTDVEQAQIRALGGVNGQIGTVTIGGSYVGGRLLSGGNMGAVNITGDVDGTYISSSGKLASVTIGGSLIGGSSASSGSVRSTGDMGAVNIKGNIQGGSHDANSIPEAAGAVTTNGKLASVTIGGALYGGSGAASAIIHSSSDMGAVKVTGDVRGGGGVASGVILSDTKLTSMTISGSMIGGQGDGSGSVVSTLDLGPVTITGDVRGGSGERSGRVRSHAKLASVTVGGSLIGAGDYSGAIESNSDMGPVKVSGDVRGGSGFASGIVQSNAKLASVTIGGALIGGGGNLSGTVAASGELTTVKVAGNIQGGSASGAAELQFSGAISAGRIETLTLNGSLIAGVDNTTGTFSNNGAIRVTNDIATLTILGSVIGNSTNRAIISARGRVNPTATSDLAIGKLTINGRAQHARIIAGVDQSGDARNADAQIGPVLVKGDWIASDLAAGATTGADDFFGNSNDAKMIGVGVKDLPTLSSKITSVVIGGQILGTPALVNDHFGFVAENIGSFKVKNGTTTYTLIAGNGNDDILLSLIFGGLFGGDTRLNEI